MTVAKGTYSSDAYAAARAYRATRGVSDFTHTDDDHATATHATLDAKGAVRECRYSALYPKATPIAVLEDVTGSMGNIPREFFRKLPQLNGLLLRKGFAVDPQILFGAIGDATIDRAPLQIGQFEADNNMDENLRNLYLESGGGGTTEESYELALYFVARRMVTDAWEKDKRKGYLFTTGDEKPYPKVKRREVASIIGDTIEADIPFDQVLAEVQERWNYYHIMPTGSQHFGDPGITGFWRDRLGERLILLDDIAAVAETIALVIGIGEGMTDLDEGLADLKDVGSAAGDAVGKALATIGSVSGGRAVAAPAPGGLDRPGGNTRL
jgi:hypothetical protein